MRATSFFNLWVSRLARVLRRTRPLAWVAKSCLAAVHKRRALATHAWCTRVTVPSAVGAVGTHGEDPLRHLVALQRGKVGEMSQERVGSVYGDEAL